MFRYGFSGDNWHMSWADDGRLLVSRCDGYSWSGKLRGMHNSRLLSICGEPNAATFNDIGGYPELLTPLVDDIPRYYNFGTLALDGRIYQFLSTWNRQPHGPDLARVKPNQLRFVGAKLIYSADNGRTWKNQNGTTPVTWERWEEQSLETMVFMNEDQEAFSILSVLQMGRNYENNLDGYIYVYAPNGNTDGTMNELVMFRVPKNSLLHRHSYEFFAGALRSGDAKWTSDISRRAVVHTFPRGWVNTLIHPFAWQPSVVFNEPLGLYIMANWGMGITSKGQWFGRPSYLGLWTATKPWGPWIQIHEETAWTPNSDSAARAFAPQISPKWIAPDGKSLWLVWSDYQMINEPQWQSFADGFTDKLKRREAQSEDWALAAAKLRTHLPYYAFNTQQVDLKVR